MNDYTMRVSLDGDGWIVETNEGDWFAPWSGGLWALQSDGTLGRQILGRLDWRVSRLYGLADRQISMLIDDRTEESFEV